MHTEVFQGLAFNINRIVVSQLVALSLDWMTIGEVLEFHCTVVALGTVSGIAVVVTGYDGTGCGGLWFL